MTDFIDNSNSQTIKIFTIGFAGKSAKEFFEKLQKAGVTRLIDIRLNNVSQLAGFTKKRDLEYFLRVIASIDYIHEYRLAPTKEILDGFKKKLINWNEYEKRYYNLIHQRQLFEHFKPEDFNNACLLCSEEKPDYCHRRLAVEYLKQKWGNLLIIHL